MDNNTLFYSSAKEALSALDKIDTMLGVMNASDVQVDEKVDELRKQLHEIGITLEDTSEGTIWKKR